MTISMTPLEIDILQRMHMQFGQKGFPQPVEVEAIARELTGVGVYLSISSTASVDLPDGTEGIGKYSRYAMEGLPYPLLASIHIDGGRVRFIELLAEGRTNWDGIERPWRFMDELEG